MLIKSIGFGFDTEKLTKDLVRFRDISFKQTTPRLSTTIDYPKPDQQLTTQVLHKQINWMYFDLKHWRVIDTFWGIRLSWATTSSYKPVFSLVACSWGHPVLVFHHFLSKFSRNLFSCRRKILSVKSPVCGSLSCKASASPLAVVKPETEKVIESLHIHKSRSC